MLLKNLPESIKQLALLRTKQDKTVYSNNTKHKTYEELLDMDILHLFSWNNTIDENGNKMYQFWFKVDENIITEEMLEYAYRQIQVSEDLEISLHF